MADKCNCCSENEWPDCSPSFLTRAILCFLCMVVGIFGTSQVSTKNELAYSGVVGGVVLMALLGVWCAKVHIVLSDIGTNFSILPDRVAFLKTLVLVVGEALLIWATIYAGLKMRNCDESCEATKGGFGAALFFSFAWTLGSGYSIYSMFT